MSEVKGYALVGTDPDVSFIDSNGRSTPINEIEACVRLYKGLVNIVGFSAKTNQTLTTRFIITPKAMDELAEKWLASRREE
jgi:hypothetical protein